MGPQQCPTNISSASCVHLGLYLGCNARRSSRMSGRLLCQRQQQSCVSLPCRKLCSRSFPVDAPHSNPFGLLRTHISGIAYQLCSELLQARGDCCACSLLVRRLQGRGVNCITSSSHISDVSTRLQCQCISSLGKPHIEVPQKHCQVQQYSRSQLLVIMNHTDISGKTTRLPAEEVPRLGGCKLTGCFLRSGRKVSSLYRSTLSLTSWAKASLHRALYSSRSSAST